MLWSDVLAGGMDGRRGFGSPGSVKHRTRGQRHLGMTPCTLTTLPRGQRECLPVTAAGTLKAVGPAACLQVRAAGGFVGELPLKLPEAGRERRTRHARTLHMVVT